jgi:hypothetical protein
MPSGKRPELDPFVSPRATDALWRDLLDCVIEEVTDPDPAWNARYPGSGVILESLNVVLTAVPPNIAEACYDAIGRTSRALRQAHPEVEWDAFGFGSDKSYGEALDDLYAGAAFLARSNFGVERTLQARRAVGVPFRIESRP